MRRAVFLLFALVFTCSWIGTCFLPAQAAPEGGGTGADSWVGTWKGTIATLDSHSTTPAKSEFTLVITQADIGKVWMAKGNTLTKDESVAGVQSTTTLTRTGPNSCSLEAKGTGSGRSGFTRRVTGDLTRP